jgi:hypothetical protein
VVLFRAFNAAGRRGQRRRSADEPGVQAVPEAAEPVHEQAQEIRLAREQWEDAAYATSTASWRRGCASCGASPWPTRRMRTASRGCAAAYGRVVDHAHYDLPFEELYWNIPVDVARGEPVQVQLTRDGGGAAEAVGGRARSAHEEIHADQAALTLEIGRRRRLARFRQARCPGERAEQRRAGAAERAARRDRGWRAPRQHRRSGRTSATRRSACGLQPRARAVRPRLMRARQGSTAARPISATWTRISPTIEYSRRRRRRRRDRSRGGEASTCQAAGAARGRDSTCGEGCVLSDEHVVILRGRRWQKVLARPAAAVAGMHFFNPVHRMPLVEVIRGARSSDEAIATIVAARARSWSKVAVVVEWTDRASW